MRATVFDEGAVMVARRPAPTAAGPDILVEVVAAGINGADLLQLTGNYPPPSGTPADQPGLECAGRVVAVGDRTQRFAEGDRVMAIVSGAAQGELVRMHEDLAMPVPEGMDLVTAGCLPEALVTAHDALVTQACLAAGERVLVTGAAGGVGSIAVQLAAGLGATVVAGVRGTQRHTALRDLGAHDVVTPDEQAGGGPYDVVLELVGASSLETVTKSLATGARVVVIGVGAGPQMSLNLLHLMRARATLRGSTLRARPLADRIVASRAAVRLATHLFETGQLHVPLSSRHPLDEVAAAYDSFRISGTVGKVAITM